MDFRHFRHFRVDYADYVDYARQCKKQKLTLSHYSVKAFGLLFFTSMNNRHFRHNRHFRDVFFQLLTSEF